MAKQQVKAVSKKQLRSVTILVRYFIKATKNVVLYVENDKGDRYYVTLQRNGNHSCSCPATKECYHIARTREAENARIEARLAARAKVITLPTQKVAPKSEDLSTKGVLNSNRPFSLMKVS